MSPPSLISLSITADTGCATMKGGELRRMHTEEGPKGGKEKKKIGILRLSCTCIFAARRKSIDQIAIRSFSPNSSKGKTIQGGRNPPKRGLVAPYTPSSFVV